MNKKFDLLRKFSEPVKKFAKSLTYWEPPFSIKEAAPQIRFVILTFSYLLVYITISTILDIDFEDNIPLSILLIIISLILTRAFSHLLIIYTSVLIIIFLIKLSFMNYSLSEFTTDYEKFFRSANPLDYFKSSRPYSEKIDNLIIQQLDNSEKMKEFSIIASTKYFDHLFKEFGKPARFMSAFVFVNRHWRYVEENGDHIFGPQFQLNLFEKEGYLAGDCDDFTVFLASVFRCLEPVNLIITSTKDHVFLELKIESEEELISYSKLTNLLFDVKEEDVYFEKDKNGYWLNFAVGGYPGYKYEKDLVITRMLIK